ncbi:tetratricopeptide repeat-containing sensor histidine kinase [Psychroserpens burtonensis]|uniref:tetratricopeptide repeat-containing sensor histidine kinase n=1 Tax=Psychroserpens burtonensis TaxID=49278 RepID=UPI0012FBF945|nr:tetratricopeptide repeat protein [Psychroserpens burtonensis]
MKTHKDSFLFFYLFICAFMLYAPNALHAQEAKPIDSLTYYSNLVLSSKNNTDLNNAYVFFKQRSEQSLQQNDILNVIYNLRYVAMIQFDLGLLQESEATAVSALGLIDNLKLKDAITNEPRVGLNNHLGRVYVGLSDYPSALEYYNTALNLQQDPSNLNTIFNNIGLIYYKQANYQEALEVFTKVHQTNLTFNNTSKIARSLGNIGATMSKMKRSAGLDSLTKSLQLRTSIDFKSGMFESYIKLAEYYQDRGDLVRANRYANKANLLAESKGNAALEFESLSLLMKLNPNTNVQRYTQLVDSINASQLSIQNSYAAKKYGLEKQERLIKENELKMKIIELDSEKQKQQTTSAIFAAILILISSIFTFIYIRSRYKKEKLQEIYNTESRISKKVHDEVANDVYHVMTKLQSKDKANEDVLDHLEFIYTKTRDISKENAAIHINEDFNELIKDLLMSYKTTNVSVMTVNASKMDWDGVADLNKTTIYRVLQELMTNMRKHSEATIVVVSFEQLKGKINIQYKDNGLGCKLFKSNGLQNAESRITSINGSIIFESQINNGFKAIMSI